MGSPAVDPSLIAFDDDVASEGGSRAASGALLTLVVAVQVGWIAALAYAAYVLLF